MQALHIKTQQITDPCAGVIRHVSDSAWVFDAVCFDPAALEIQALTDGVASAGRGSTVFFTLLNQKLVLREYRRGGLARHISKTHYVYTGMERTRALREFDMLIHLHEKGLPAPHPFACRVLRKGLFYTASLVTHRLPGSTLAERLQSAGDVGGMPSESEELWCDIGTQIARFHAAGVYHADLNAHNIMLDKSAGVFLIDFDRSTLEAIPTEPARDGWCLDNMNRLERSLMKIAASSPDAKRIAEVCRHGFALCKTRWGDVLKAG